MTAASYETPFHARLRAASRGIFGVGAALLILGIAALVFPMVSTLAITLFVGWIFLFSGSLMFMGAFSIHGTGPFFGALLVALLSIGAGAFLVFNPLAGAGALTLLLGALFMLEGAFEIFFAFEMRPLPNWMGMLLSGMASVLLSILIAAGWPEISQAALGLLLGVNFISTGIAYLMISRAVKP